MVVESSGCDVRIEQTVLDHGVVGVDSTLDLSAGELVLVLVDLVPQTGLGGVGQLHLDCPLGGPPLSAHLVERGLAGSLELLGNGEHLVEILRYLDTVLGENFFVVPNAHDRGG